MKVKYFLWLLFFVLTIKINSQELYKQFSSENSSDTFSMVDTLKTLYLEGNPINYYHWNEKLAHDKAMQHMYNTNPTNYTGD